MMAVVVVFLLVAGALVFALVRSILLQRRVDNLENRLATLERSVRGMSVQKSPSSTPAEISLVDARPDTRVPTTDTHYPLPSTHSPIPNTQSPLPASPPSRTREEWESFIGGRLLNRIGALAIIIGIGFFLKHAFDNDWISEPIRVLVGVFAGAASLFIARRTHVRGFAIFAQGLVGAGIGILYLSVYASFNYYSLLPQIPSFIIMAAVTTTALVHGVWYRSFAVAVLGWAGGYLTPWMLSSGEPNEIKLFVYLAFLTVAMLGLVIRMPEWSVLQPLTLAGTWLWYFTWHVQEYDSGVLTITLFFVLAFWASFVATDQAQQRLRVSLDWHRWVTQIVNASCAAIAVMAVVAVDRDMVAGIVLLFMAAAYLVVFAHVTDRPERKYTTTTSAIASALALIGSGYLLSEYGDVAVWAVLAAVLVVAARRFEHPDLVLLGQITLLIATVHLVIVDGSLIAQHIREYEPVLHERTIGFLGLITGSFGAFWSLREDNGRRQARTMFLSIAAIAGLAYLTVEVNDLLRSWRLDLESDAMAFRWFISVLTLGMLWTASGLSLFVVGLRQKLLALVWIGVVTLGLGILTVILRGISVPVIAFHQPVLNFRVASLVVTALLSGVGAWFARRYREVDVSLAGIHRALALGAIVAVLSLLSGETLDWFERSVPAATEAGWATLADLRDEQQLALSLVWLFYSVALMVFGFWRSNRGMRLMAMGLFSITIVKIFLYDLSSLETSYRIVSFIVLGAILLSVSYGYQRYKHLLL